MRNCLGIGGGKAVSQRAQAGLCPRNLPRAGSRLGLNARLTATKLYSRRILASGFPGGPS